MYSTKPISKEKFFEKGVLDVVVAEKVNALAPDSSWMKLLASRTTSASSTSARKSADKKLA